MEAKFKPPRKTRVCLKCNKKFQSTGPGNRICPTCTGNANRGGQFIPVEYKVMGGDGRNRE